MVVCVAPTPACSGETTCSLAFASAVNAVRLGAARRRSRSVTPRRRRSNSNSSSSTGVGAGAGAGAASAVGSTKRPPLVDSNQQQRSGITSKASFKTTATKERSKPDAGGAENAPPATGRKPRSRSRSRSRSHSVASDRHRSSSREPHSEGLSLRA